MNRGDYMYCQVCGFEYDYELVPGNICSCCGYEYTVDDYITMEEIDMIKKYRESISPLLRKELNLLQLNYTQEIPIHYTLEILRNIWIKNGCNWTYNSKGNKPIDWSIDKAKKQLKNIGIDINIIDKQKILKEFGDKYTREVYVNGLEYAKCFLEPSKMTAPAYNEIMNKISPVIEQLTTEQKEGFLLLFKDIIITTMFSTMNIFDTQNCYQLMYSKEGEECLNLQEVAQENEYGNGFLNGEIFNWIKDEQL